MRPSAGLLKRGFGQTEDVRGQPSLAPTARRGLLDQLCSASCGEPPVTFIGEITDGKGASRVRASSASAGERRVGFSEGRELSGVCEEIDGRWRR
jgi:hypothetical protein